MNEGKEEKAIRLTVFIQDGPRVIGRVGKKLGEDADFLTILNESGKAESISKRLIVRYVAEAVV